MKGELLKLLLRHIRIKMIQKYIPKNCVFCDIGCGFNSTFIRAIFKHIISGLGFGKKIKSNEFKNIIIKNLKVRDNIPLNHESFDFSIILDVLKHLADPGKIMNQSYRILKNDGTLLFITPSQKSKPFFEFLSFRLHTVSPEEVQGCKPYLLETELQGSMENIAFHYIFVSNFEFRLNRHAIGYE